MAVELSTLVDSLKRAVSPPGQDNYSGVTDTQWVGYLTDAFWQARLSGLLTGYEENNAEVSPTKPGKPDLTGDQLQLVVFFAAYNIALTAFQNTNSLYRAKSGPVEYEVQKSAQTQKALLDALKARMDYILKNLSALDAKTKTSVVAFDAVIESSYETAIGGSTWYLGG